MKVKFLVIVESPAKSKTINKYLGKEFIVKSSIGHIRDLPKGGNKKSDPKERAKRAALTRKMSTEEKLVYQKTKERSQLIEKIGVDPNHDWKAKYEIVPGKEKVVEELKKIGAKSDLIYLATDLDREGEAIAWHLKETLGGDPSRYKRVIFSEITKKAIQEAFKNPTDLNLNRVHSQQTRRFLDRVVGFMLSPLLWEKIARGLSAGRVQSVAVKLIVEREKEINLFQPEEYWEVKANLIYQKKDILFDVVKYKKGKFNSKQKEEVDQHLKRLQNFEYQLSEINQKKTSVNPPAPFITSTLQQTASTRLHFSIKRTMTIAQKLYEAGYITYMRTDSTNLSMGSIQDSRDFIQSNYDKKYLPEKPRFYTNKTKSQEAHEAIRPTQLNLKNISNLGDDEQRLYELIWSRTIACQMTNAQYMTTSYIIKVGDYELIAKGRVLLFDGFTKLWSSSSSKEDEKTLINIPQGSKLLLDKLNPSQHFTKPPARYSEASLVRELEKRTIGRPSTYANIISTIQERGYVELKNKRFYAQKIGDIVTNRLEKNFPNLMNYDFTATMENDLDEIASGHKKWKKTLNDFYVNFNHKLEEAKYGQSAMKPNIPIEVKGIKCKKCNKEMQIRHASTGVFLGCSGYNLPPKERCKETINLINEAEIANIEKDDEAEVKILKEKERCPRCQSAMNAYLIDKKHKLHLCGTAPDCEEYKIEKGDFQIKGYDGPTLECDKCQGTMEFKSGRFGKFFACTNETCQNTRKLLKNGQVAPPKMTPIPTPNIQCEKVNDTYVLRDSVNGLFLAASQFPKKREIRQPYIDELIPYKNQLPEKYHYILEAPVKDNKGRRTLLRHSRKEKSQYVMTEDNKRNPTGWKAIYKNNSWEISIKKNNKKSKT